MTCECEKEWASWVGLIGAQELTNGGFRGGNVMWSVTVSFGNVIKQIIELNVFHPEVLTNYVGQGVTRW